MLRCDRRAVPLALALLNCSNPGLGAMDALSRLSHDTDAEVAQNAVVALGARASSGLF
jgi:26S proteasome regulatory subunit N1